MDVFKIEIIESVTVLILYLVVRFVITKTIEKVAFKYSHQKPRIKIVKRFSMFYYYSLLQEFCYLYGE